MKKTYREDYIEKLESGGALYGRDVLSLMLSNAFGGRDMTAEADRLLDCFPSVKAVLRASLAELSAIDGVSPNTARYLFAVGAVDRVNKKPPQTAITGGDDFFALVAAEFCGCDNEYASFYLVNGRGKIVAQKQFTSSRADTVSVPTEEFLRFLTEGKAYGLYCAHNHVAGGCAPSLADDGLTARIARLCGISSVKFFDHAIIDCDGNIFSYARSGRLEKLR